MYVERRLRPTLEWILTVMDSTEAQLRFGGSLTDSADPSHPLHPLNNPPAPAANSSTTTSSTSGTSSTLVIGMCRLRSIMFARLVEQDVCDLTRDLLVFPPKLTWHSTHLFLVVAHILVFCGEGMIVITDEC